jgi:precorrin-8X/cobalt-precorrin-8 methylmutase
MTATGVIILVHGSRGAQAAKDLPDNFDRIIRGLQNILPPGIKYCGAALQFNSPDLPTAVAALAAQKVNRVIIAPYFLFAGVHITQDIPELINGFRGQYPTIEFILAGSLGVHESLIDLVASGIMQSCPQLVPEKITCQPEEIETRSMAIIDSLLPASLPGEARTVVKRIVHAAGDSTIARQVRFSPAAVNSGLQALKTGCLIVTDVKMAMNGINRKLVEKHNCSVLCALEAGASEEVCSSSGTRSAKAFKNIQNQLSDSIVVIGNAPTALLSLVDLIDQEKIKPALVVAMPVGFVQAKESKDELMKRDVPFIAVAGNRGGSNLAAATVNALLKLADNPN